MTRLRSNYSPILEITVCFALSYIQPTDFLLLMHCFLLWQAFRSPVRYIRPTYATLCILYGNLAHYDVHYVCRFSMNWTAFILLIATLVPTSCGNFTPSPRVGHKRWVLKAFSTAVDMMTTVVHCIIQYRPLLCTLTVTWPLNMRIPTYCLHTSSFPTRDSI